MESTEIKTLLSLRNKLVKQMMSIPYDTTSLLEMNKMNKLNTDIIAVNKKISKAKK